MPAASSAVMAEPLLMAGPEVNLKLAFFSVPLKAFHFTVSIWPSGISAGISLRRNAMSALPRVP